MDWSGESGLRHRAPVGTSPKIRARISDNDDNCAACPSDHFATTYIIFQVLNIDFYIEDFQAEAAPKNGGSPAALQLWLGD
jgi:hypothetical protein